MRVLHICTEKSWRGGENQIRLLIEGAQALGIENFVAVPGDGRSFQRFSQFVTTIPLGGKSSLLSVWRLVRFCRKERIDLIDAQGSGGLSLALWVKRFYPRVKIVAHRRVDIPVAQNFFSRRKYLNSSIDVFVAISNKIKRTLVECGINENKIKVVRSAIDVDVYRRFQRAEERKKWLAHAGLPEQAVLVGNASALVPTKGNQFLIEALPRVLNKVSRPVHVFLAGEGEQREELESLCREAGLQGRVTFLGHVDDVPAFLSALDVLAMPSLSEGLGTILLDATAAGAAITATDVGGIPEIIVHNETGLLFAPGDVEALAINLIRLIEDEATRKRLQAAAVAHVRHAFSLEQMVSGNVMIYRDALGR